MTTSTFHLPNGRPKTVIVTGGAGGIGAQTIRSYHVAGCNVVIADLPFAKNAADRVISSLSDPDRAMYHPTNIINWDDMRALFREAKKRFGQVDIVVANAGLMESKGFYEFEEDKQGELEEPTEAYKIIDVNLKGSMNNLDGARGSVVLIASTSGYFGGTGVVSYISSKHGVVGLGRSSQRKANELGVRVNVVAPFFTPTYITTGYSEKWKERDLPANTVEGVASVIMETSIDPQRKGHSMLVAGSHVKEIETARTTLTKEWLGEDIADVMAKGGKFFEDMGGYTLPKARS
ncbi:NAD(P)-binding protein [Setomelanomma holmii]|uniref:NAD(P)-binding protein n=1 Tax=Setomelanomma holmii TaxID=210430 RepID=A0A9P4LNH1_9PLEO|nr:NAD(P)-binding protein [Setomelanomma holmii]